eukprot:356915-Chlamydomonas_euryale.AAC.7
MALVHQPDPQSKQACTHIERASSGRISSTDGTRHASASSRTKHALERSSTVNGTRRACAKYGCHDAAAQRTSARSIDGSFAPMSSTPYFASMPFSDSALARFRPVWPPMVGNMASGRS